MRKSTGLSLLILIFLSLSLTTFSLLSLSGARADQVLSRKAADRTSEYYSACSKADEQLARTDALLADYYRKAQSADDPKQAFLEYTSDLSSFSVPINEQQVLLIELEIKWPVQDQDTLFKVKSRRVVNTGDWNPDLDQHVLLPQ